MSQKVFSLTLTLLALLLPLQLATAQDGAVIQDKQVSPQFYPIPNDPNPPNVLGQDHAYSVTFRGNGEAVVSARVTLTNTESSTLSKISLRVPKVEPQDVIAYQVVRERQCARFEISNPSMDSQPPCAKYMEPDYYGYYGNSKYQRANIDTHGDTVEIALPQPISPEKSGSFILYYRAFGYAKKGLLGAYVFNFETLKVEDRIRNLTVGISTDSDLVLKDAKGKVNYRFDAANFAEMKTLNMGSPMASSQFDQFYQQIGYGTITKNASNLQPLDSYSVKGAYAENNFLLYGKEITITLVVLLLVIWLSIFLGKKAFTQLTSAKQEAPSQTLGTSILLCAGLGFAASVLILLYTTGLIALNMIVRQLFGYGDFLLIINVLLVIISIAVYALLLFLPSIMVGVKKGVSQGLGTFVATIIWLIIHLLLAVIVLFFIFRSNNSPYPIPFMRNMMDSSSRSTLEKSTETIQLPNKQ